MKKEMIIKMISTPPHRKKNSNSKNIMPKSNTVPPLSGLLISERPWVHIRLEMTVDTWTKVTGVGFI